MTGTGPDPFDLRFLQQVIDVPVHFFLAPDMAFDTGFEPGSGPSDVKIGSPAVCGRRQPSGLDFLGFCQFDD
jgi:hypothetical protein